MLVSYGLSLPAELQPPQGVLLLGVPGCGTSVAAPAAAGVFGVPLLRLAVSAVHDTRVGRSERHLRETLATAELLAPCVGWVDEIEKVVATPSGDSGPSTCLLASQVMTEVMATRPLSVVMTEPIAELRRWAATRTVPAG